MTAAHQKRSNRPKGKAHARHRNGHPGAKQGRPAHKKKISHADGNGRGKKKSGHSRAQQKGGRRPARQGRDKQPRKGPKPRAGKQSTRGKRTARWTFARARKDWVVRIILWFAAAVLLSVVLGTLWMTWTMSTLLPSRQWVTRTAYAVSVVVETDAREKMDFVQAIYPRSVEVADLPEIDIGLLLHQEDKLFYHHPGVSLKGLARAAFGLLRPGNQGGASTITMQLARHLALTARVRTITRKLREIAIALRLEWLFSKDEILSMYLSTVYLGGQLSGFGQAAKYYYGKPAASLTPVQWASLVVALPNPSRYRPGSSANRRRTRDLLQEVDPDRGWDLSSLSELVRQHLDFHYNLLFLIAEHAIHEAGIALEPNVKYVVSTTLNSTIQTQLRAQAKRSTRLLRRSDADAGLLAVIATDGEVLGLSALGDRPAYLLPIFGERRQTGSLMKPFIVFAALRDGVSPDHRVSGRRLREGGWRPKNHNGRYPSQVSLQRLLGHSVNTAAVRLFRRHNVSFDAVLTAIFGDEWRTANPSRALGTNPLSLLEVANAYNLFAAGEVHAPRIWRQIRRLRGPVLARPQQRVLFRPRSAGNVAQVAQFLRAPVEYGTAREANLADVLKPAGKTGTTQQAVDRYFVGFPSQEGGEKLVFAAWVGNLANNAVERFPKALSPVTLVARAMCRVYDVRDCSD